MRRSARAPAVASAAILTTVCVTTLPPRCPICAGPYFCVGRSRQDPAERARYRCPICRWHIYLRPVPSPLHEPAAPIRRTPRASGHCPYCGAAVIPRRGGRGRPRTFCSRRHLHLWWLDEERWRRQRRHEAARPYTFGG